MVRKYKTIRYLSNIAWVSGTVLAAYVLIKAYFFSGSVSTGSCPLVLQGPLIIAAISLLALSFVFSLFEPSSKDRTDQ